MRPVRIEAWKCGRCGRKHFKESVADRCCRCHVCGKRAAYGGGAYCGPCQKKSDVALAEARLLEAKRELARVKKRPVLR